MTILFWLVAIIQIIISSSSSSDDSDSTDDNSALSRFAGEFVIPDTNPIISFTICEGHDRLYITRRRVFGGNPLTDYVSAIARSAEMESDNPITQVKFNGYKFIQPDGVGIIATEGTLTYNPNTKEYTSQFDDSMLIKLDKTNEKPKSNYCIVPEQEWSDVDVPFVAGSNIDLGDICVDPSGGCTQLDYYIDVTKDGGACWSLYRKDEDKFTAGGDTSKNVQIIWDGLLRITDWNWAGVEQCSQGTEMAIWISEYCFIKTDRCADLDYGVTRSICINCDDTCEKEIDMCPLFSPIELLGQASKMAASNILENDDENNMGIDQQIIISFSNATIANLLAILIVFVLFYMVIVIFCWYKNKKRNTKHQTFDETVSTV